MTEPETRRTRIGVPRVIREYFTHKC
jgi:hypothetical protein